MAGKPRVRGQGNFLDSLRHHRLVDDQLSDRIDQAVHAFKRDAQCGLGAAGLGIRVGLCLLSSRNRRFASLPGGRVSQAGVRSGDSLWPARKRLYLECAETLDELEHLMQRRL